MCQLTCPLARRLKFRPYKCIRYHQLYPQICLLVYLLRHPTMSRLEYLLMFRLYYPRISRLEYPLQYPPLYKLLSLEVNPLTPRPPLFLRSLFFGKLVFHPLLHLKFLLELRPSIIQGSRLAYLVSFQLQFLVDSPQFCQRCTCLNHPRMY